MSRERKSENIAIGKRLAQVQAQYGKTNEQMAYLTGYTVHTYQCVLNGDHGISVKRLARLAEDEVFSHEIVYILTGKRGNYDYSIEGNYAYFEKLPSNEKKTYIAQMARLFARLMEK